MAKKQCLKSQTKFYILRIESHYLHPPSYNVREIHQQFSFCHCCESNPENQVLLVNIPPITQNKKLLGFTSKAQTQQTEPFICSHLHQSETPATLMAESITQVSERRQAT